jgi:hypothetical protein
MEGDGHFVIWIVLIAVPVGLLLISRWARARPPGDVRARTLEREPDDTERD